METQVTNPPPEKSQQGEPTDNLKRLHGNLTEKWDGFAVPLDVFYQDMADPEKRARLHKNLTEKWDGFNVPLDQFTSDIGYSDKKKDETQLSGDSGDGLQQIATSNSEEQATPMLPVSEVALQTERNPLKTIEKSLYNAKDQMISDAASFVAMEVNELKNNPSILDSAVKGIFSSLGQEELWEKMMGNEDDPGDIEKIRNNLIDFSVKSNKKLKESDVTRSIAQVNDGVDAFNYALGMTTQGVASIIPSLASFGGSTYMQQSGATYLQAVEEVAKQKGITPIEVIESGLDSPMIARVSGGAGMMLDKIGLKGVKDAILGKSFIDSFRKRAIQSLMAGVTEGLTETGQDIIQEASVGFASDKPAERILMEIADPVKRADAFIGGFTGGSFVSGIGSAANSVVERVGRKTKTTQTEQPESTSADIEKTISTLEQANDPKNKEAINTLKEKLSQVKADEEAQLTPVQETQETEVPPTPTEEQIVEEAPIQEQTQPEVVEEIEPLEPMKAGVTVSESVDLSQPLIHNGETGVVEVEGQQLVFKTPTRIYELGNKDEVSGKDLSELGIEIEQELDLGVNEDYSVDYKGKNYRNGYSDPLAAINRNEQGDVVSVNLDTEDGKKRTIRGQAAQEIAYNYLLKNFEDNASQEQRQQLEQRISEEQAGQDTDAEKARITGTAYTLSTEEQRQLADDTVFAEEKAIDQEYIEAVDQRFEKPAQLQFPDGKQLTNGKKIAASEVFGIETDEQVTTKKAVGIIKKRAKQYEKLLDCLKNG